jgi:P27 family predicted phage terminase small subunit
MPGPPPEHPHLRLLKGNPGKRPPRNPPEPARNEQCPEPPEHLTGYAREAWLHLAPELHRLNLLTVLDVGPFSAYCCAYAHWKQAEETLQRSGKLVLCERVLLEGKPTLRIVCRIARMFEDGIDETSERDHFWHAAKHRLGYLVPHPRHPP